MLLKFNTRSFLLPPMQGQRYAYMTPSMARADVGGGGKSSQGGKGETRQQRKTKTVLCMKVILASSAGLAKHQSN